MCQLMHLEKFFQQFLSWKILTQANSEIWKYKLQQLFEMLSLSLDTGLESFSPLINGPVNDGLFEVTPVAASVQPCCVLVSHIRAPAWCCCCHGNHKVALNPYRTFQMQSDRN